MHPLIRRLVDHRSATSFAHHLRRKRFEFFLSCISTLPRPINILDLGGEQVYWERMEMAGQEAYQITILNLEAPTVSYTNLRAAAGNAADLSIFSEQTFDLVYSNSVIEHLGSYEFQKRMAGEVMRVGKSFFIQTPNRYFPIEPHFLVPFFQFFPHRLRLELVRHFNLGWYRKIEDPVLADRLIRSHRLLNESELQELFPNGSIYREKLLGITKSLTIHSIKAG